MTKLLSVIVLAALLLAVWVNQSDARHEALLSRSARPLTPDDALYVVRDVAGRAVPVRDVDGDGLGDLVIARGPRHGLANAFDLHTSKDGRVIRRLYMRVMTEKSRPTAWDAGGDVDGDGVPDLLLGFPEAESGAGRVLVISGKSAQALLEMRGEEPNQRFGTCVVFVGDVDRDGRDDFVVSATEADPVLPPDQDRIASFNATHLGGGSTNELAHDNGARVPKDAFDQQRLGKRSASAGFVSLRAGRDGSETWRVSGVAPGHGFGTSMQLAGDLDADGIDDLAAQHHPLSAQPTVLLAGATGHEIARIPGQLGPVGSVGDVDRDGVPDLYADTLDSYGDDKWEAVRILSGRTRTQLFRLPYPDMWSGDGTTVGIGDFDGDGYADVALGDGNFNLPKEGDPSGTPGCEIDVRKLTLAQAAKLESQPWCAFAWESGCAVVYSGCTREVLFGVWALPGSRQGLGLEIAPLPDVNGDGSPDILITDGSNAFAFAGPARSTSVEPGPR